MVRTLGLQDELEAVGPLESQPQLVAFLLSDTDNPGSVVSAVVAVRENLRSVRDRIPIELWEEANGLYLRFPFLGHADGRAGRAPRGAADGAAGLPGHLRNPQRGHAARRGARLRGRWAGCWSGSIFTVGPARGQPNSDARGVMDATRMLRLTSSLQAYHRQHGNAPDPHGVVRYLLHAPDLPRSVLSCLGRGHRRPHRPGSELRRAGPRPPQGGPAASPPGARRGRGGHGLLPGGDAAGLRRAARGGWPAKCTPASCRRWPWPPCRPSMSVPAKQSNPAGLRGKPGRPAGKPGHAVEPGEPAGEAWQGRRDAMRPRNFLPDALPLLRAGDPSARTRSGCGPATDDHQRVLSYRLTSQPQLPVLSVHDYWGTGGGASRHPHAPTPSWNCWPRRPWRRRPAPSRLRLRRSQLWTTPASVWSTLSSWNRPGTSSGTPATSSSSRAAAAVAAASSVPEMAVQRWWPMCGGR